MDDNSKEAKSNNKILDEALNNKLREEFERRFERKDHKLKRIKLYLKFIRDETETIVCSAFLCLLTRKVFYGKYLRNKYKNSFFFPKISFICQVPFYFVAFMLINFEFNKYEMAYPRMKLFRKVNYDV